MTIKTQAYLQGYLHEKTAAPKYPQWSAMRGSGTGTESSLVSTPIRKGSYFTNYVGGEPATTSDPKLVSTFKDYSPGSYFNTETAQPQSRQEPMLKGYSPALASDPNEPGKALVSSRDYSPGQFIRGDYTEMAQQPNAAAAGEKVQEQRKDVIRDYVNTYGRQPGTKPPPQEKMIQGPDSYTRQPVVRGRGQREQDNTFSVVQGNLPRPAAGRADISAAIRNKIMEIINRPFGPEREGSHPASSGISTSWRDAPVPMAWEGGNYRRQLRPIVKDLANARLGRGLSMPVERHLRYKDPEYEYGN